MPQFIFVTCQPGAERVLKAEMALKWPGLKFAFSRPGFLTFKSEVQAALTPDFELGCVFARARGLSIGKVKAASELDGAQKVAELVRDQLPLVRFSGLHVWLRADDAESDSALTGSPEALQKVTAVENALKDTLAERFEPEAGEVIDVALVEPEEWWIGYHSRSMSHRPWAGGIARIMFPKDAPSRAYLKAKEGTRWPGLPLREGDVALEFGSSPGGASFALLEQGLNVIGVDPGDMAEVVKANARFKHLRQQARQVALQSLGPIDWIFCDMNVPAREATDTVGWAVNKLKASGSSRLHGGLITLKLAQWDDSASVPKQVDELVGRLKATGFERAQAAHLYYNRQEVSVACLTELGVARASQVF